MVEEAELRPQALLLFSEWLWAPARVLALREEWQRAQEQKAVVAWGALAQGRLQLPLQ